MACLSATAVNPGAYEIPIRPRSVLRVYVESGFELELCADGEETAIRIAGPLAIVTENDPPLTTSTAAEPPSLGRILICGQDLCQARRLQVMFFPGVWFRVEPQRPATGVWGPAGSKGLILVCTPCGEIAIWFGRHRRQLEAVPAWA